MHRPLLWLLLITGIYTARSQSLPPYQPARTEVLAAYENAIRLDSLAKNAVLKGNVRAHWQPDNKGFWYRNTLADSSKEYWYVEARTGAKTKLADSTQYSTTNDNGIITGGIKSRWIRQRPSDSTSPDKQWIATIQAGNIFLRAVAGGETRQCSFDGDTTNPYGHIQWSPDSKHLVVFHSYPVAEKPVYYVLSSVDTSSRGILQSHEYAQPGDPFTGYVLYTLNIADKKLVKAATELYNFLDYPWVHWRTNDNTFFTFEKADRGHQRYRIIEVNVNTGFTRNLIDQQTNTFIYESRIFTWYTAATNEIIWSSEKDGYNHLYLVDAVKGSVKNVITHGNWVVRKVDSVDEVKRVIWFQASGMNTGEDPYNIHYYRIGFDGRHLVSLTPANASHQCSFSPGRQFFLDNYSRPDLPAVTELRRTTDGKLISIIERADITAYQSLGIRMPEVFVAKGRDGITDIWGIVCRPPNFDSTKKYPVIENIYAGPQDAFVPKRFMNYGEMQSMAALGFIVVQCDGMGTANRSKAFHDVCWQNLADAGLPDRILWIKALAQKYAYIDTSRVGLYGTSAGGQNSAGALLFHPEFYKAAVSACGCHDNRIDKQWWNEQWMGYPVGPHYAAQSNITNAGKLQGSLLLIVGEADNNVPPESTFRFASALIRAGKVFDLLVVPGMGHSDGGPYGRLRKRDFFVRKFFGVEPPDRNSVVSYKP
ncbi:S9 family peptidase [Niastella yeongjuensis]|nr:prolyl oligopeptidase family serine peptidase [Niastella yeongjuensis]SEP45976.1 Dipeptidyl aminopeptidase/acylaminoacyl peptidase [Niastella yeongjuensis]